MTRTHDPNTTATSGFQDIVQTLRRHPLRWLGPAAVVAVLCTVYALLRPTTWEASQALVVRDETTSKRELSGRFQHPDEMKTVQETILELAHSRTVLAAALVQVGPSDGSDANDFPADKDIAALQGAVKISPPKGLEFGKSEVFYLKVKATRRERALALAKAMCEQIQARLQELRNDKAQSLVHELTKTADLAQVELHTATAKLTDLERQAGSDLAELRMLNESPSGDSDLRRTATEIENELRQARVAQHAETELLCVLSDAADPIAFADSEVKLLALPNKLFELQPALRRLKDGLLEAQLRTAQLAGSLSELHPQLIAARESESEVIRQLHAEVAKAQCSLAVDAKLTTDHIRSLEQQRAELKARMNSLAGTRAEYGNVVAQVKERGEILKTAQQALADARASQAASHVASMITPIDAADTGTGPAGPSRSQIVLLGGLGGLILGIGIVFLTSPAPIVTDLATIRGGDPLSVTATPQEAFAAQDGLSLKQALKNVYRPN